MKRNEICISSGLVSRIKKIKKRKNQKKKKSEKCILHTAGCVDDVPLTPSGSGRVCASADDHAPPPNDDQDESAEDDEDEDEDEDEDASSPMLISNSKAAWMPAVRARKNKWRIHWVQFGSGSFRARFRFVSGLSGIRFGAATKQDMI
jgi:hypothetical protein